jgi:hypothetical protein
MESLVKKLNWKNDGNGQSVTAWASRAVGGKYHVSRREGSDGVWFEVEHLVNANPGASVRYAGCWDNKPVQHRPIARTWLEAMAAAEADNQRLINARDRERRLLSAVERVAPE